jgi:hypothetical protein
VSVAAPPSSGAHHLHIRNLKTKKKKARMHANIAIQRMSRRWWVLVAPDGKPSLRSLATKNDEKSAAHTNGWRLADKAQAIFVRVIRRGVFHAGNVNVASLLHRSDNLETTFFLTWNKILLLGCWSSLPVEEVGTRFF